MRPIESPTNATHLSFRMPDNSEGLRRFTLHLAAMSCHCQVLKKFSSQFATSRAAFVHLKGHEALNAVHQDVNEVLISQGEESRPPA